VRPSREAFPRIASPRAIAIPLTLALAVWAPRAASHGRLPEGGPPPEAGLTAFVKGQVATTFDFGGVRVGTDSPWLSLRIHNSSSQPATGMRLNVATRGDFHFVDYQYPGGGGDCEETLAPGGSCRVSLQFSPSQLDAQTASLAATYTVGGKQARAVALMTLTGAGTGRVVYASSDAQLAANFSKLVAGDTLMVEDGEYSDAIFKNRTGTSREPIIVRARHDGGAHVRSVKINAVSQAQFVGFHVGLGRNGISGSVVDIAASKHLLLKRLTAKNARETDNFHVFEISESEYVTVEDCAGWGSGRITFLYYDSAFGIFRRVWGQHLFNDSTTFPRTVLALYYGANSLVENSVCTQAVDASPGHGQIEGFKVNSRKGLRIPDNNTLRGNVAHDLQGPAFFTLGDHDFRNTHFYNNVAIGPIQHYRDITLDVGGHALETEVQQFTGAHALHDAQVSSSATCRIRNSVFEHTQHSGVMSKIDGSLFRDVSGISSPLGTNRAVATLGFDEASYGRVGAHLIRPAEAKAQGVQGADVGAEVLYRYVEVNEPAPGHRPGELSNVRLWPHPLEERVWRESLQTISITYENRDGKTGLRGVWKDADALRRAYAGR